MSEAPLPNDPAARTADGTLKDVSSSASDTPTTTSPATSTTPSTPASTSTPTPPAGTTPDAKSPAATPPAGPPDTYTLKASEGKDLDPALLAAATPIFKELGLDNAAAQKLADFWNAQVGNQQKLIDTAIQRQGEEWSNQIKADPEMGSKMDAIKVDVGRALDVVLSPKERSEFMTAMDSTMIGNNPAFVRTMWKLAQKIGPGTSTTGGGPSPHGQNDKGVNTRPSAAQAMYPNLGGKAA